MKRLFTLISILSLLAFAVSCEKPEPQQPEPPVEKPEPEKPEPEEPEKPEPEKPVFQDVTLHSTFDEGFNSKEINAMVLGKRELGPDLRYYPGFPSWNEKNTKLLMMRVDPADAAGASNGPNVISGEHTFYGSYSIRMRLPDIKAVQPNIGLNAVFTTAEQDENHGYSTIEMMWKMADPTLLYLNTIAGTDRSNTTSKDPVSNFKPSGSFYTYGFDWHADKVTWWILAGGQKQTVKETTEAVPFFPARLKFMLYHSKNNPVEGNTNATQAPFYPYEFEIDKITYEPYEDEIEAWHNEYFKD